MKAVTFSKRNLIEFFRSPLMLFFTIVFPVVMFFLFQIIKRGTGATDEMVPMFTTIKLIPSIAVFSFSFLGMNISLQIAGDRASAFQSRLRVSPMKPVDFFMGYFLPCLLLAVFQILICFVLGVCFGLKVSTNMLWALLAMLGVSVFYIACGILIGSLFGEKTCGGVSSILVNLTAIFSAMFFPLTDGAFKKVLSFLPFLPSVEISQVVLVGAGVNLLQDVIILFAYCIIVSLCAIIAFNRKLESK